VFGSLALEKKHVQQDIEHRAFSQQHAVLDDQDNETIHTLLWYVLAFLILCPVVVLVWGFCR
jgi:hypothetical protein